MLDGLPGLTDCLVGLGAERLRQDAHVGLKQAWPVLLAPNAQLSRMRPQPNPEARIEPFVGSFAFQLLGE
ncbi:hypothetical protein XH99_16815 [Bradyrhizobium nanningense]|uniref:Uncharacterized protein n=1 Tax=Bradyrhizobium nanningense TaxID=1325118 RepID=A0A4Q0S4D2_9BRAD|nr:hypothetical protein XH84_34195 [Bradyrhizobium nanningense]RXH27094.1 hypothetical protein XH99_16815 [Bradyrhizobium nanningense]